MPGLLGEFPTIRLLGLDLVTAGLPAVAASLAARSGRDRFHYLVTPNADHFVRLRRDPASLTDIYRSAGSLLLDSRVVRGISRVLQLPVPPVVAGSDLTLELLERWIEPDEPVTVVGTTPAAVARLRARYRLSRVAHHCPPFGFESSTELVEQCAKFVEVHPSRFVFLACGAPRQEILALRILQRGQATGIGLCIGAAIDQVGGHENRAPAWIRDNGLEWSWRLIRQPGRMGRRYLADTRIFTLLLAEARRSRAAAAPASSLQ
ncbi:MAG: WecB/TagA/CpsF family glycosyltransferase [Pseudomonadota bacterium]|nr:WecB/TagA/CpsF family glycosyltransferase [Pseudomonadota bacterium]